FLDRAPEELVALPRPCAFARPNELGRPHEAADVCRQDSIVTAEHPGVRGCRGGEILAAARRARPSDLIACAMNTGQGSGNTSIDSCLVVAFRATAQLQQSGERKKQYRRDPLTFDWGVVMKMQRAGRPGTTVPAGSLSSPAGWLAVTVLAQACSTALAQESQQRAGVLEEVIVTAEFREANVQDTPIAITAVTAQMLEARSQTNIFEVAAQAPNVTLKPGGAAIGPSLVAFIRGIGQTDFNYALEPGVGLYIDDVYYPTLTGSLVDLLDLDRVEVLRGPQGTLAGKNSIGGAIKLYSK